VEILDRDSQRFGGEGEGCESGSSQKWTRPAVTRSITAAGIAADVIGRNWRTPGIRVSGH
jgi:hypothetical protein